MTILVTNDDGIYAPGLDALAKAMKTIDNTTVVAPDREQSAVGHAITLSNPLRITEVYRDREFLGYACSGTPADAVKLGVKEILDEKPDVLISGINVGANVGASLIYSGTVSAATEGTLLGIPSIAISLDSRSNDDWSVATDFAIKIVNMVLKNGLPEGVLLNVNIPKLPPENIQGIKIVAQGKTNFNDFFEEREDPRGHKYFWMCGTMVAEDDNPEHDVTALAQGYITVTPVHYNLTAYDTLKEIRKWGIENELGVDAI